MQINKSMNLGYLAECMGSCATPADAANMLDILLAAGFEGASVDNVPDLRWREFLHAACAPTLRTYVVVSYDESVG